jgi:PAS domain S-box-containing protein
MREIRDDALGCEGSRTMRDDSEDRPTTRRTLHDLFALAALPAGWVDFDQRRIAETLADALQSTLHPDFVYLHLPSQGVGNELTVIRTARGGATEEEAAAIGGMLAPWLVDRDGQAVRSRSLPSPIAGGMVNVALVPVLGHGENGVLAAGADRAGFPSEDDRLLLGVTAQQIAIVRRRLRAEEQLRQANARLQWTVRGSSIGLWEIEMPDGDLHHGRVDFTNVWERLGYAGAAVPTDLPGALALLHSDDREPFEHALTAYLAGETPEFEIEVRVRHRDATYHWILKRGVAVHDAAGKPVRFVGTDLDITARKQAEGALRQSEERFRGTFENAAVGIAHMDADGRYLRVNQKLCDILGYSRAELLEMSCRQIVHPDDLVLDHDQFLTLMRGEVASVSAEKRYLRKDGSPAWVNLSASLQADAAGQPAYAIEIIEDISEQKRLGPSCARRRKRPRRRTGPRMSFWPTSATRSARR